MLLTIRNSADLTFVHRAVLASFFLKEELGHIGRVGCTLCLIGSLIIVLNAPADKDVQTVDEYLHYALQPGADILLILQNTSKLKSFFVSLIRFPHVPTNSPRLLARNDLCCSAQIRSEDTSGLYVYLFSRRLCFCDGYQRLRCRPQTHF